jgi:carbon-monoxide dehydrogenase small subunit
VNTRLVSFVVNGRPEAVAVEGLRSLLATLRDSLGLTAAKHGCGQGGCGACTVLLDGEPVLSCLVPVDAADGHELTTIEGLARIGGLHPLQRSFQDHYAAQCGFCTPGMILAAKALLDRNPHPSREEIGEALAGNLCRCTGYQAILEAVEHLAQEVAT